MNSLLNKGFDRDVCTEVVSDLQADGYINDEKVARSILSSRKGTKSEGRLRLRARMIEQGVSEDVTRKVLLSSPSDSESVDELIRSLYKTDGPVEINREEYRMILAKLSRLLVNRGYPYDLVAQALSNFFKEVE